ncbi:hypothetical protein D3C72_1888180 [compost metagenome]
MDLHPVGAGATVAVQLLVQQGLAFGQQAPVLLAKQIAPGHLGVRLADEIARLRQPGLPGESLVGKQVPSGRIPAEDIHG